jgi:hypothetical protein
MTEKQLKSGLRLSHRWVGVGAALLVLVTGVTGFLLQHPGWLGEQANPPSALAADPVVEGRLLRGTYWGVESSEDGGFTWREIPMLAPPTDVIRIVFAPDDPRIVLALGGDVLVGSRDGGRVWRDMPLGPAAMEPGLVLLDVAAAAEGNFTVLTDRGMVASADGGETWAWVGSGPQAPVRDLRSFIHDLHTGHLLGAAGRRLVEAGALALIFITVTGVVLFRRKGRFIRG